MTTDLEASRAQAPTSFLADPIEEYFKPVLEDLAEQTAAAVARVPRALSEALAPRYSVDGELGRGGVATVYRAFDQSLARWVAVKVLQPAISDALSGDRFSQEIEITARLQHSRIVPVHDRGKSAGLFYYIMRHFEDGSLRQRIQRDGKLSIAETIAVTKDVAHALDHAHRHSIVHRDIKPENILLEGDAAYVADFGVARIIDAADRKQLTLTGVAIGTPHYMSPEQADSGAAIDGRSDVYSLGCVVYEMLAGERPFTGPGRREILAKHASAAVPDLTVVRDTVTPGMQRVLETALRKTPADRYPTAGAFAQALEQAYLEASFLPVPVRRKPMSFGARATLLGVAGSAALLLLLAARPLARNALSAFGVLATPDTSRVVVLPFQYDSAVRVDIREQHLVGDAMRRWRHIAIVDDARLSAARDEATSSEPGRGRSLASAVGAGRFVRGTVSLVGDSLRLYAGLYEARSNALVRDGAVRVGSTLVGLDSASADLAAQLITGVSDRSARVTCRKTTDPDAYRACAIAHVALGASRLETADSALVVALSSDPNLSPLYLSLAEIRFWRRVPVARWKSFAERAAAARDSLSARDQLRVAALVAFSRGEVQSACALFRRLVAGDADDFSSWYSLAGCLRYDDVVVADARTPSGWRFRSSYHGALAAYRRAFELRPSLLLSFEEDLFGNVRELFVTAGSVVRPGTSRGPGAREFLGTPTWSGDTLVFIPFPAAWVHSARPITLLPGREEAVKHQRRMFHDVAASWVATTQGSAPAMEALSLALEMSGDVAALDTLRRARSLASERDRLRIAIHEVFLGLKFALPDDERGLRAVRSLAHSVLQTPPNTAAPYVAELAAVAALTGRASRAAMFARQGAVDLGRQRRMAVTRAGNALLVFSALGGPADSIRSAGEELDRAIDGTLSAVEQRGARQEWVARAASLAFPHEMPPAAARVPPGDDPVLDAQLAALRGDQTKPREFLSHMKRVRFAMSPTELSFDGIYPEVAMLVHMGDDSTATSWLDPALRALPLSPPSAFADFAAAGSLGRLMVLRAELAARSGDRATARQWARAVATLWSDADAFLQPTVKRMDSLSR